MTRSGMGLLPGIALAFGIALLLISAIALNSWWATGIGMIGSVGGGLAVIGVILKTVLSEDDGSE